MGTTLTILDAGIQSFVEDYPGRRGLLSQGFFPAGAIDHYALRAGNVLCGNEQGAAGIEIALGKFKASFAGDCTIALTGAEAGATVNGEPVAFAQSLAIRAGDELKIGMAKGPGFRTYLTVSGGIDVPEILGSRSTYTMGALGGHEGRKLANGDTLPVGTIGHAAAGRSLPDSARPAYQSCWDVEVMRGPQADPDYLTAADMETFFAKEWSVDRNSNRTGIRLETHRFEFARESGGIAGGHPSNILDDGYPVGGINLNGDTPVILCVDGPTSGGFIVFATVVEAGMWKIGQLRPGSDTIRFREVTLDEAVAAAKAIDESLDPNGLVAV